MRLQLDHVDRDVAAAQRDREREPGDAAADDQNLLLLLTAAARVPAHCGLSFAALTMSRKRS